MLVCALFLGVSVVKAEFEAMHKLSISPGFGTFDPYITTFSIMSNPGTTFSFFVDYELRDLSIWQDMDDYNKFFPLYIDFDTTIFDVKWDEVKQEKLSYGAPWRTPEGMYVSWNNTDSGSWNPGGGSIIELTFTLKDNDSLAEFFSTFPIYTESVAYKWANYPALASWSD